MVCAGTECEFVGGADEQRAGVGLEACGRCNEPNGRRCIGEGGEWLRAGGMGVPRALSLTGGDHTGTHLGRSLLRRMRGKVTWRNALHVHMQIDAIGERPRQACAMSFEIGHGTSTVAIIATGVAARARIAGGDEREARGKAYGTRRARHDHHAIFQRLSQRLERVTWKERQLVEKQNATMGEAHFAGAWPSAAADQACG